MKLRVWRCARVCGDVRGCVLQRGVNCSAVPPLTSLVYSALPLSFNPLNPELNPICYLLALLAHHFLHVSRIRVKTLTIRLLMSYIYIYI